MNCPACGEDLPPGTVFCTSCGATVTSTERTGTRVSLGRVDPDMVATEVFQCCPSCKVPVEHGLAFCANCGHDLGGHSLVSGTTRPSSSGNGTPPPTPVLTPLGMGLPNSPLAVDDGMPAGSGASAVSSPASAAREADYALRAGDVLWGQYRVEAPLGRGGMGEVYRATDVSLGQGSLAIKLLPAALAAYPTARDRLRLEVAAARTLDHPSVLRVFEFCEDEHNVGIVMELLEGATLRAHLDGDVFGSPLRLSPSERLPVAAKVIDSLASALDYIHAAHLVHRDIKPSNVMLIPDGVGGFRVKLLDFGLVHAVQGSGSSGLLLPGTPGYIAPELMERTSPPSPASDLYSFGRLVYFLLTGRKPSHRTEPPSAIVQGLTQDVDERVMSCLEVDPADRPKQATLIASAVREAAFPHGLAGSNGAAGAQRRQRSAAARGQRKPTRRGKRTVAPRSNPWIAAGLNFLVLGGGGYLYLGQQNKAFVFALLTLVLWAMGLGWISTIVTAFDAHGLAARTTQGKALRPNECSLPFLGELLAMIGMKDVPPRSS